MANEDARGRQGGPGAAKGERVALGKAVARAWNDPAFRAQLIADPQATLTQAGVKVPEGVTVRVVENTKDVTYVVLPQAPTQGEFSPEVQQKIEAEARLAPIVCCIIDGV